MNAPMVTTDPVLEAIARKLSGIGGVPIPHHAKMIRRAAKAARDAARDDVQAELAALRTKIAVLEAERAATAADCKIVHGLDGDTIAVLADECKRLRGLRCEALGKLAVAAHRVAELEANHA